MIDNEEFKKAVRRAIKSTINKFREQPYYFFTESDIHSYFYYKLYSRKYEVTRDGRKIYCVHREYPTNFRYDKDKLLKDEFDSYPLSSNKGSRGHYDIAVINPKFIETAEGIHHVINKNINDLKERSTSDSATKEELLFAIEFKYIINNSKTFIDEVKMDNKKLAHSKKHGVITPVNLVFCNCESKYLHDIEKEIIEASQDIYSFLVKTWYVDNNKKNLKVITNKEDDFLKLIR